MANLASQPIQRLNQQVYHHLRLVLGLNLRRQLFIVICDDLHLRDRVVQQLQTDLSGTASLAEKPPRLQLVTLTLHPKHPSPVAHIAGWLRQHQIQGKLVLRSLPRFQVVGAEQLTRQSGTAQRRFLEALRQTAQFLPALDVTWVLWLSRPWARTIQQSVPEFWRWHTGVFEFVGDPTPLEESSSRVVPGETVPPPPARPAPTDVRAILNHDLARLKQEEAESSATPPDPTPAAPATPEKPPPQPQPPASSPAIAPIPLLKQPLAPIATSLFMPSLLGQRAVPQFPLLQFPVSASAPASASASSGSIRPTAEDGIDRRQISDPSAMLLLQQIDGILSQTDPKPSPLGQLYQQLGNLYRDRLDQGDNAAASWTIAIAAHQQAAEWFEQAIQLCPEIWNDLGNLHWLRSQRSAEMSQRLASLQHSVAAYQQAAAQIVAEAQPAIAAMVQHNLGTAYGDLAQYDQPIEHLRQAIECYQEALRYRTAEMEPLRYAATQNNLGTVYWKLSQYERAPINLQQAIAAYQEALRYSQIEENPLHYAMIQNNVGTAHWQLAQIETPVAHLQAAIQAYEDALQYRTMTAQPAAHAATQNNLGAAYRQLAQQADLKPDQVGDYLSRAIVAYTAAIATVEIVQQQQLPTPLTFDLGSTYNNLGLAHRQLVLSQPQLEASDSAYHLEQALRYHLLALQHWQANPELNQVALGCVIQTIRTCYQEGGLPSQNSALSQVPGHLLPEVLAQL